MNHTEKHSMYVVDYEAGSSFIHEFMTGKDLKNLLKEERNGSVHITNLVNLGNHAAK